ncbi:limbic system-associated membrane protein isoform X1 [Halyomorpha halys]|uniref:limbic system-associated membrane protein isoform X1 n=1 Tax=Halyomorpha halys TaxID=286706 RepID=UPI0034D26D33
MPDPSLFSTIPNKDWSLQIKFVQLRDAGYYECQVTSHPPFSIIILLKVVEARVEIAGAPEKYVKTGSSLELKCDLYNSPSVPEFVFWYHNDRMVNYDKDHGLNITTDLINKKSYLEVKKASREHSGNYTCVASNAYPDSTMVHILNDENPAAMQTGSDIRISARYLLFYLLFIHLI